MSLENNLDAEIKKQWELFVEHQKAPAPSIIRPEIQKAWERCRDQKVDPYTEIHQELLSPAQLAARKRENAYLLAVAGPVMEELFQFIDKSNFVIWLADADGYMIKVVRAPNYHIGSTKQITAEIREGNCFAEHVLGANGCGTPLVTGEPIQIQGAEHYCLRAHGLASCGAPVRGPEGNIIGSIGITGKKELIHAHTLGMVVATANAINKELKLREIDRQKQVILESLSEGIFVLNTEGYVTYQNPAAKRILEVDFNLVGKKLEDLGGKTNNNFKQIISRQESVTDELVDINLSGETVRVSLTVSPINTAGRNRGMVVVVAERKRIRQIINKFVGMKARYTFADIIGKEKCLLEAIQLAQKVADSESTVLITGESGTGKEVFAQAIHNASNRRGGPFVAINCAAIPRDLLASELFGYDEGAFTGARRGGNIGKFELADGGTLFLDEIGDMPLDMQVVLLRVIEERNLIRIGGKKSIPVNVRIIAATHKNLAQEVASNRFRADLYYRLNVINIHLPPLRDRKGDIPLLINKFASLLHWEKVRIDSDAQSAIINYSWPGNVRELRNVIESALGQSDDGVISLSALPENIRSLTNQNNNIEAKEPVIPKIIPMKKLESDIIREAIDKCNGNISLAARQLGISRSTIYRKLGSRSNSRS